MITSFVSSNDQLANIFTKVVFVFFYLMLNRTFFEVNAEIVLNSIKY